MSTNLKEIKVWVNGLEVEVMQLVVDELVDRGYRFDQSLNKDIKAFYSDEDGDLCRYDGECNHHSFLYDGDWDEKEITILELLHNPNAIWKCNTGIMPDLPHGTLVQCQLRGDMDQNGTPSNIEDWSWPRSGNNSDIISWRIAEDNERLHFDCSGDVGVGGPTIVFDSLGMIAGTGKDTMDQSAINDMKAHVPSTASRANTPAPEMMTISIDEYHGLHKQIDDLRLEINNLEVDKKSIQDKLESKNNKVTSISVRGMY